MLKIKHQSSYKTYKCTYKLTSTHFSDCTSYHPFPFSISFTWLRESTNGLFFFFSFFFCSQALAYLRAFILAALVWNFSHTDII